MEDREFEELSERLSSTRAGIRLKALDQITVKSGRGIVRRLDDDRTFALLTKALGDPDRRVRRTAARGLRPWVRERPELLDAILPGYATTSFDGGYTHLGLYDTRAGAVWIPRFAALRGHAALLRDGNTDWYFKFEFYAPGQAPGRYADPLASAQEGHLVLHYILDWSYARQELIPEFDERRRARARAEQDGYAAAVTRFYQGCGLAYGVRVHYLIMTSGQRPRVERDGARIPARA
jgi:hypothetical protein